MNAEVALVSCIVGLDVDGVMADYQSVLDDMAFKRFNRPLLNPKAWDLGERYGCTPAETADMFAAMDGEISVLPAMAGAAALYQCACRLAGKENVVFVSCLPERLRFKRLCNLSRILGEKEAFLRNRLHLVDLNACKLEAWRACAGNKQNKVFVDDRLRNLYELRNDLSHAVWVDNGIREEEHDVWLDALSQTDGLQFVVCDTPAAACEWLEENFE